jgi:ribosome-binding factor A
MRSRRLSQKEVPYLCIEPGSGDGLDPRFDRPETEPRRGGRKTLQLCRAAERTLAAVLAGECNDDILRELVVLSVVPGPKAGRLLVTVGLPGGASVSIEEVLARLDRVAGRLRSEVAAAVSRRKAPELAFQVVRCR